MTATAFSAAEIGYAGGAPLMAVARELEAYAAASDPTPSVTLTARIASAVAREAAPTPPMLFWRALIQGSTAGAFGYLAASVRAALGIGRVFPAAVRVQAIALILTMALALAGGGAVLAAGAATVLEVLAPRPAPEQPAVVDRSTTPPRATPERDKPGGKPGNLGNNGQGGAPRGSGQDHDGEGRDNDGHDGDDDDGHDRSDSSHDDGSDDGHDRSSDTRRASPDSDG